MKPVIIGSAAMLMNSIPVPQADRRRVLDIDFVAMKEYAVDMYGDKLTFDNRNHAYYKPDSGKVIEFYLDIDNCEYSSERFILEHTKELAIEREDYFVATPATLLAIKLSHRYKKNSVHFLKTMRDIQTLRQYVKEDDWTSKHAELLDLRSKETYTYGHPKLNQKKKDFFNTEGVDYVYDHDWIHTVVAKLPGHLGTPAYTYFSKGEVMSDKDKFFSLPDNIRILATVEESYVLALERSIVPFDTEPLAAFKMALEKVCTSITSGWFREYSWENYDRALGLFNADYKNVFLNEVEQGNSVIYKGA